MKDKSTESLKKILHLITEESFTAIQIVVEDVIVV